MLVHMYQLALKVWGSGRAKGRGRAGAVVCVVRVRCKRGLACSL